ncbi:MAG TPA: sigma-70 family RNA polymerase sigma factor [Gemmataceae bacterium]|jgi:RNA polymerase sigma factor (sigma-70 family)|nr:sigma-70 family RNA polymerase sigma factor [Gemmataceae bacterium]
MAEDHPNPLLQQVRHLVGNVSAAALPDGQLLERFLDNRDETAVEILVRRYGALVFGACRRVLRDTHAAEDVFQATFLVLIRKAPSLDRKRPLASWLYTVAYRLALRARANETRRRRFEEQAAQSRSSFTVPPARAGDVTAAVEEELHRLPERLRAPLVLCYLDGKTNDQAAAILGCPRGSMAARLSQALARLRHSLARRGFVAPAAAIATLLASTQGQAAVPLPLLVNTARAAIWFASEDALTGAFVSSQAVALARGAMRTMLLHKLKIAAVVLLAAAMFGTGATMLLKAAPHAALQDQRHDEVRLQVDAAPGAAGERSTNAAGAYGQAFMALRRGFGGDGKLLADCLTMPLDARAREIVTKGAYALRMMQRGAALPRCNWDVDFERGIKVSYDHGDGAEILSCLACLRARLRFEDTRNRDGIDDLMAALTLARHVSRDGTLDSIWAGYQIERRASDTLALYLPRLDARTVHDLKTRLEALPPRGSVAAATLRMEEAMLDWIVGEVKEARDSEGLLVFLSQLSGRKDCSPEKNGAEGRALLEACGGTAEGVLKFTEAIRPCYVSIARTLELAPDRVVGELEREEAKLAGNPVFKIFAPVLRNIQTRQARNTVRWALLAAAVAVQGGGADALKQHPDPVAGGLFDHVPFAGGFELRSQWKDAGKPLVLTAGRRSK